MNGDRLYYLPNTSAWVGVERASGWKFGALDPECRVEASAPKAGLYTWNFATEPTAGLIHMITLENRRTTWLELALLHPALSRPV